MTDVCCFIKFVFLFFSIAAKYARNKWPYIEIRRSLVVVVSFVEVNICYSPKISHIKARCPLNQLNVSHTIIRVGVVRRTRTSINVLTNALLRYKISSVYWETLIPIVCQVCGNTVRSNEIAVSFKQDACGITFIRRELWLNPTRELNFNFVLRP